MYVYLLNPFRIKADKLRKEAGRKKIRPKKRKKLRNIAKEFWRRQNPYNVTMLPGGWERP